MRWRLDVAYMIEERPRILTERRVVGLVWKPGRVEGEKLAEQVAQFLISRGIDVRVDSSSGSLKNQKAAATAIEDMDVDFVIPIGGDGTVLYTLSRLRNRSTPLFCINLGTIGFMTESDSATALPSLQKIIEGECIIERCINLSSGVEKTRFEDALNEVYVTSQIHGRMLTFKTYIDGVHVSHGRADGIMASTPSGSSAYALSAGGSILSPSVRALIVVPVCPPMSELRPMVVPDNSLIEIELVKPGATGVVVIDGQTQSDVNPHDKVWVKKAKGVTRFIRMYDSYYDRLRSRLVTKEYR